MSSISFSHAFLRSPRLFSSLLFRLCILMVAAFGSRPSGVSGVEQARAPLIVGLRAHHLADAAQRVYDPASPSFGSRASGGLALRSPTLAHGGGASPAPLESLR